MSYGQRLLKAYLQLMLFPPCLENHRPDWLGGLELDFFYPRWSLGIEFQGDQHFVGTVAFGSCAAQKKRDYLKRHLCKGKGITLLRLTADDLQYGKLRSKLRRTGVTMRPRISRRARRKLDLESRDYRATLVTQFDSPTARNGVLRKRALWRRENAFRQSQGLTPLQPKTERQQRLLEVCPVRVITESEIEAGKTPLGGFTKATLNSWGVPWPPPRGWKRILLKGPQTQTEETLK